MSKLPTKLLSQHRLIAHNTTQDPPTKYPFTLTVPARTDLWRKPPQTFSSNQPTFYQSLPLSQLASASATVTLNPEILFDQVGLVVLFPSHPDRWVKAGLEYEPRIGGLLKGIVATREWSDWSVSKAASGRSVEVSVEREITEDGEKGPSMLVKVGGEVMREVTWVFAQEEQEVWVGFYGARPAEVEEALEVKVESFGVRVWE